VSVGGSKQVGLLAIGRQVTLPQWMWMLQCMVHHMHTHAATANPFESRSPSVNTRCVPTSFGVGRGALVTVADALLTA